MKRYTIPFFVAAAPVSADVPNVVTDIAPVHSLVSMVMDGVGNPDLIMEPGSSPHHYSMRPSEAGMLAEADLVVWVGHGLTPWLEGPIENLAGDAHHLEWLGTDNAVLLSFREGELFAEHDHDHGDHEDHDDHGEEDHADHDEHDHDKHDDHDHDKHDDHEEHAKHDDHDHDKHDDHDHEEHAEEGHDDHDHEEHAEEGHDDHEGHDHDDHKEHAEEGHDDHDHDKHAEEAHDDHGHDDHDEHAHGEADPHLWLDPLNAQYFLSHIADELSELDPENAETYRANAKAAQVALAELSATIDGQLEPIRGEKFIVMHDAYHYFEERFGIEAFGSISPGDASTPGAARIKTLREALAGDDLACAFKEPQMDPGFVNVVTEGLDTNAGTLDPLGANLETGATLYSQLLQGMADEMVRCMTE